MSSESPLHLYVKRDTSQAGIFASGALLVKDEEGSL